VEIVIDEELRLPFRTRPIVGPLLWLPTPFAPGPAYLMGKAVPGSGRDGKPLDRPLAAFWLEPERLDIALPLTRGVAGADSERCCFRAPEIIRGEGFNHGFVTRLHAVPPWPSPRLGAIHKEFPARVTEHDSPPFIPRRYQGEFWDPLVLEGVLLHQGRPSLLWRDGDDELRAWQTLSRPVSSLAELAGHAVYASRSGDHRLLHRDQHGFVYEDAHLPLVTQRAVQEVIVGQVMLSRRVREL
jgi:hypothetical protein